MVQIVVIYNAKVRIVLICIQWECHINKPQCQGCIQDTKVILGHTGSMIMVEVGILNHSDQKDAYRRLCFKPHNSFFLKPILSLE